jgi:putative selenate reductase
LTSRSKSTCGPGCCCTLCITSWVLPGEGPGVIFNLSVGYNYEGVLQPNVQSFLKRTQDAGPALARCVDEVAKFMPEVKQLNIPARMSNNVTLSTMHGCPPGEIGKIARYLIEEWGLHTSVKLNPTLLGPETVRGILNDRLGYRDVTVPDLAFEHDLKYPDALNLLRELRAAADAKGVVFGVKLSNTLEVVNRRDVFSKAEKMMYLSGRPLHAITVNLAHKLMEEFDGDLLVSFAGGADAFNAARLLACGMTTITTCSDLLRPGSYSRLGQVHRKDRAGHGRGAGGRPAGFHLQDGGPRSPPLPPPPAACARRAYARSVPA